MGDTGAVTRMESVPAATTVSQILAGLGPALDEAFVSTRRARPPVTADADGPLPEDGAGLDAVVGELAEHVRATITLTAPEFCGWIAQGPSESAVAARIAVAAGGLKYFLHPMNHLEHVALGWLADLCGIPRSAAGEFVSGGSVANLVALGAARQHAWERHGVDVAEHGLPAQPQSRVYASVFAHRTIHRSAGVLGLGRSAVVPIAVDAAGRMRPDELARAMEADRRAGHVPVAVVAVTGTTDIGSIDPVAEVVEVARAHDCWVHVDGAYGLTAHASDRFRDRFDGVADADSWIVDPHKWLATGAGVGAVYVRDADLLTRAFAQGHAAYFDDVAAGEHDVVSAYDGLGGHWTERGVEMTSPPRGVMVWAVLRELGRRGVAARVDHHVGLAALLAREVRTDPRLDLALEPELSIVCFRHLAPAGVDANNLNAEIVRRLHREDGLVPSTTKLDGRVYIRPCFINPRQTEGHVKELLAAVRHHGAEILGPAR